MLSESAKQSAKQRHMRFLKIMEQRLAGKLTDEEAESQARSDQFMAIMADLKDNKLFSGAGGLVKSPEQAKRIAFEELRRWTELFNKNPQEKKNFAKTPKKLDPDKYDLAAKVLENAPEMLKKIFEACELIGLNERITYHKVQNGENIPYTHIFDNETVALKHKDYPMIIIYGPHIKYINNFIEG